MTSFSDKERAEEAKFAHDEETQFRIAARRNRLLGAWAAEKMGLTSVEAEAYGKAVIQADFEEAGDEDVIRKLLGDLTAAEADAYAKEVIQADFEEAGDEDVIRKVLGDLTAAGVEVDEAEIRSALEAKAIEARRSLMGGV